MLTRDPRTYTLDPAREGLPGHPGLGRDDVLFVRLVPALMAHLRTEAQSLGLPLSDLVGKICAERYWGPLGPEAPAAPEEPELTPEVALENIDPVLREYYRQDDLKRPTTPAPATPKQEARVHPNSGTFWESQIEPRLIEVMGEEAYGRSYFGYIRYVSHDTSTVVLSVKHQVLLDDLANLRDVLDDACAPRKVELIVKADEEAPSETKAEAPAVQVDTLLVLLTEAKVETIDQLLALEDRELPKVYQQRLDDAAKRSGGCIARMAAETAILEDQRKKDEARRVANRKKLVALFAICRTVEQMRQGGNPKYQRQYSRPSHFDTDGSPTRDEVNQASKACKTPNKRDLS